MARINALVAGALLASGSMGFALRPRATDPTSVTGGRKAGLSGYESVQNQPGFQQLAPHISWYSDYQPDTPDASGVKGIPMLWGADGSPCDVTSSRLQRFQDAVANSTPEIMFGFFEPDCQCQDSAQMSTDDAAADWDTYLAPLSAKGSLLGSPSLCKQKDEDFLAPFSNNGARSWDVTAIHVNKNSLDGVQADVEHYRQYGKPIWVAEFACVDDQGGFNPCTDQGQINGFIQDAVSYFESQDDVIAYGPSNGNGLGDVWPLFDSDGNLSQTGQTYLSAIGG